MSEMQAADERREIACSHVTFSLGRSFSVLGVVSNCDLVKLCHAQLRLTSTFLLRSRFIYLLIFEGRQKQHRKNKYQAHTHDDPPREKTSETFSQDGTNGVAQLTLTLLTNVSRRRPTRRGIYTKPDLKRQKRRKPFALFRHFGEESRFAVAPLLNIQRT